VVGGCWVGSGGFVVVVLFVVFGVFFFLCVVLCFVFVCVVWWFGIPGLLPPARASCDLAGSVARNAPIAWLSATNRQAPNQIALSPQSPPPQKTPPEEEKGKPPPPPPQKNTPKTPPSRSCCRRPPHRASRRTDFRYPAGSATPDRICLRRDSVSCREDRGTSSHRPPQLTDRRETSALLADGTRLAIAPTTTATPNVYVVPSAGGEAVRSHAITPMAIRRRLAPRRQGVLFVSAANSGRQRFNHSIWWGFDGVLPASSRPYGSSHLLARRQQVRLHPMSQDFRNWKR